MKITGEEPEAPYNLRAYNAVWRMAERERARTGVWKSPDINTMKELPSEAAAEMGRLSQWKP